MNGFSIEKKLTYYEGANFFKRYLKSLNLITIFYFFNIIVTVGEIGTNIIIFNDFAEIMTNLGFAIFAMIPFVVIHESIHLLAYIILGGGKNIHVGMKKGIFYSSCSNYIISCREYMFVALLPIIITFIVCAYIYIIVENSRGWISIFYLLQLLSSNVDVGIASYCKRNIVMFYYEDCKLEEMYFIKKGEN